MRRIILFSIIALTVASCAQKSTSEDKQKKADAYKIQIAKLEKKIEALNVADTTVEKTILVKTQPITIDTVSRNINYTANIIPFEELYMAPASPGKISKIYVEIGDKVAKGQKLVQMDQTQLNQAKIQLESLQKDYDRIKTLKETGSIAEQQYDQIKTQYEVLKNNVQFLEENTVVVAPYSGIITGKYFEDGETFSGAPNTQAGKAAIVTLNQINFVKATVNVSEQYYTLLDNKTPIELSCDIFAGEVFKGQVYKIYPTIDALTRTFKVELKLSNANLKLRPGMYGRITLELGKNQAMTVPADAVMQQEGTNKRYVFIEKGGIAKRIDVVIGDRFDEKIEIISNDIQVGDNLVIVGQAVLNDNNKVKVVE
jgi:RND family efflux transporter MFP subunit